MGELHVSCILQPRSFDVVGNERKTFTSFHSPVIHFARIMRQTHIRVQRSILMMSQAPGIVQSSNLGEKAGKDELKARAAELNK